MQNRKEKSKLPRNLQKGINDFATVKKDLLDEWDYEKNKILPEDIKYNNNKVKVAFKCKYCGKEILSTPYYHNVPGCRSCRIIQRLDKERMQRIKSGETLNQDKYKDILIDWDYNKNNNNNIFIDKITPKYTKPVNWKCHICGYEWTTSVYKRVIEKNGCSVCKNIVVKEGINDLQTKYPVLAEEWSKRNQLNASQVLAGGAKNYWWKCRFCGGEWKATIHNRVNEGSNCPKCSGYNTSFSEQAIYYYFTKAFDKVENRYIDKKTKKEIDIYVEDIKLGVEYDGYVYHVDKQKEDDEKTKLLKQNGIKLIRIRENKRNNRLPELLEKPYKLYYLDDKNRYKSLDSIILSILNDINVKTIIVNTYEDRFLILHNMHQGFRDKSFENNSKGHLKYWDYELNNPLLPSEIGLGSKLIINWKCPKCSHNWKRTISAEMRSKGCSECNKTKRSERYNLLTEYPASEKYWDYDKNSKIKPEDISPNTHNKYWFICSTCNNSFESTPDKWAKNGVCPDCGKENGRKKRCKKVAQYSLDGKYIKTYESARAAFLKTGISYKSISVVCNNGRKKQTGGYIWKFVED